MQFKTIFATSFLLLSSLVAAAPKQDGGFEVVIHYVDAPNCDVQCGTNKTEVFSTITSTRTNYVVVSLQTAYGSTQTLGSYTTSSAPTAYATATSTSAAVPAYTKH